ncbi:MAG: hypothetical protein WD009_05405 [Phycisphaeraceae bacterium]
MSRDRVTQLIAVAAALACLLGAALLVPGINAQRRELDLSFDPVVGDRVAPSYAITTAALGSFRGLAVDVLWYRAERLKQEGKFYEANTLAEWITQLQPRFPQVWSFQAWNMAYNISVATHTPEERWQWVNRGVRLLREEGIPNNPTAMRLYRELGWIFLHKLGAYSDDMHWYYKAQFAEEWQELLGNVTEGVAPDEAAGVFAPVAEAAEAYFGFDAPLRLTVAELDRLAEANPDFTDELRGLGSRTLVHLDRELPRVQQRLRDAGAHRLAEQLDPIAQRSAARLERARRQPHTLLVEDVPATQMLVDRLRQNGFDVDGSLVRRLGRLQMYLVYFDFDTLIKIAGDTLDLSERDVLLLELRDDPELAPAFDALLAFLRARTLTQQYHMDPRFMHELMVAYGPLDWRHPASHAIYWSAIGAERARPPEVGAHFDMLNTQRQIVHGLQALTDTGRVSFDPVTHHIDLLPEPAFIPSYELALTDIAARATELGFASEGVLSTFEYGLENFLLRAIMYSYLYGDMDQARGYHRRARERFGGRPGDPRYLQTMDALVTQLLREQFGRMQIARQFIDAMLQQGFRQGLGERDMEVFNRFLHIAEYAYDEFQRERYDASAIVPDGRERLQLPPTFQATLEDTYISYMRSPQVPLMDRVRIFRNTPASLLQRTYPRFHTQIRAQARQINFDPDLAFPVPEGIDAAEMERAEEAEPQTIERQ